MTLNIDAKFNALGSRNYRGSQEDRELLFYKDNGATSNSLPDAELQFLTQRGFNSGVLSDRWKAYLNTFGYRGSVDDMLPLWWREALGSSLYLDFTTATPFASTSGLDPRITFSRTTNATVTNSSGLIANAPMNLLTFSEQFDNAAWTKLGATITANAAVAPDGTTTADSVVEAEVTSAHRVDQTFSTTVDGVYTFSFYAKKGNGSAARNFVQVSLLSTAFGSSSYVNFDIALGTITFTGAVSSASITDAGNGWYRCVVTDVATATGSGRFFIFGITSGSSANQESYAGNANANMFLWGAQLEQSSTATTYNPTTVKNLLGFTENFDNAAWTKSNAFVQTNLLAFSAFNAIGTSSTTNAWYETSAALDTTVNSAIAPDGTQTAALLAINSATSFAAVFQVPTTATANTYAYSVYCKAVSTDTTCRLLLSGDASLANFVRANFTLSGAGSASVADVSGTAVSAATPTIQAVGDGWYRCTIAGTLTAPTSTRVLVYPGNPGAQTTASQTLVWGAQLVQGTSAGDYKATYAAAAAVGYTDIYGQPFAQKLVENTASADHKVSILGGAILVVASPYVFSVYAKAGERSFVRLMWNGTSTRSAYFNLATGAIGTVGSSTTAFIEPVGNGWYRCAIRFEPTGTSATMEVYTSVDGTTTNYTGDGTSGIYIFGAQLSDSASVDPYVYQPVAAPSSVAYYGPRFDYDPVTLAPKGLLIEEQRTNLLTYSQDFSNAAWGKFDVLLTPNAIVAPSGTLAASLITDTSTPAVEHYFENTITTFTNQTYTSSIYVKAATASNFQMAVVAIGSSNTVSHIQFNQSSGVYVPAFQTNGLITSATATAVGNGWYRCSVVYTLNGTVTYHAQRMYPFNLGTYAGTTVGHYFWGAQLEAGSFATSYIPTVASQVTRAADSASMIGNNFARWYNQTEGTLFADYNNQITLTSVNYGVATIKDSGADNAIGMLSGLSSGFTNFVSRTSGVIQASLATSSNSPVNNKLAGAYAVNNFGAAVNGADLGTDTSGTLPVVDRMLIGANRLTNPAGQITLKRIAYYNRRLSNTELQGITS